MSDKEYKSLIPKNTVLPLALLILVIVFGVVYILVDKNADDKDYKIFDVVTPLLALIISVIGSIYVYNAYNAQQEQIKIQKDELERNQKDVELNRQLDLIYRQLELCIPQIKNKEFLRLYNSFSDFNKNDGHRLNEFDEDFDISMYWLNTASYIDNFIYVINSSKLDISEKEYLRTIVINNLNKDFIDLTDAFYNLIKRGNTMFDFTEPIGRILKIKEPIVI